MSVHSSSESSFPAMTDTESVSTMGRLDAKKAKKPYLVARNPDVIGSSTNSSTESKEDDILEATSITSPETVIDTATTTHKSTVDTNVTSSTSTSTTIDSSVSFTPSKDYTGFLLWYMIPEEIRHEITRFYFSFGSSLNVLPFRRPRETIKLFPDRYRVIDPEYFLNEVKEDGDWVKLSDQYLLSARAFNEVTQLNFLVEAIKNASTSSIEAIFQRNPNALKLLNKIQENAPREMVDFILASRKSAEEIIEMFRIIERYSDFDLAEEGYIAKIREIAFERDDCELLMFTNAYSDITHPVNSCQSELVDSLRSDKMPKTWTLVCDGPCDLLDRYWKRNDCYIKFRLFSEPVNTNGWTLDMFAVAFQEYDAGLKLSMDIIHKKRDTTKKTCLAHICDMIPLIPDPLYRKKFIEKHQEHSQNMDHTRYITEFEHFDEMGRKCKVKVVPYLQQSDEIAEYHPKLRIADTEKLVSCIIKK